MSDEIGGHEFDRRTPKDNFLSINHTIAVDLFSSDHYLGLNFLASQFIIGRILKVVRSFINSLQYIFKNNRSVWWCALETGVEKFSTDFRQGI